MAQGIMSYTADRVTLERDVLEHITMVGPKHGRLLSSSTLGRIIRTLCLRMADIFPRNRREPEGSSPLSGTCACLDA